MAPGVVRCFDPSGTGTDGRSEPFGCRFRPSPRNTNGLVAICREIWGPLDRHCDVTQENDNGGEWLSRNAPFFNRKGTVWEGGILDGMRFVGRHIVEAFFARGHRVTMLTRRQSPDELPGAVHASRVAFTHHGIGTVRTWPPLPTRSAMTTAPRVVEPIPAPTQAPRLAAVHSRVADSFSGHSRLRVTRDPAARTQRCHSLRTT
jgi:hypothetical protein